MTVNFLIELTQIAITIITTIFSVFVGAKIAFKSNRELERQNTFASMLKDVSANYAAYVVSHKPENLTALISAIECAKIFADDDLFKALDDLKAVVMNPKSTEKDFGNMFASICFLARERFK